MNKLLILFLSTLLFFSSCRSKRKENHQQFLREVRQQKEVRTPEQYQQYVKQRLQHKQSELAQINAILNENQRQFQDREAQDSPLNSYASAGQIKMKSMKMNNQNLVKQKRVIEREIFFLQSQIELDP